MAALARDRDAFRARDALVVVVGPEDADTFGAFWHEHAMPFVGLADPRHEAADRYAQEVSLLRLGRMPAQFVIDRWGIVRYAHYSAHMADIPTNDSILAVMDGLDAGESRGAPPS